jgi:hypothetical protein
LSVEGILEKSDEGEGERVLNADLGKITGEDIRINIKTPHTSPMIKQGFLGGTSPRGTGQSVYLPRIATK